MTKIHFELEREQYLEMLAEKDERLVELERIIAHKNHSIEELCYALEDLKAKP